MTYYFFDNEQDALNTEQKITENIKNWVIDNAPDALNEDGISLKGKNHKTGEWDSSVLTDKWAIPELTSTGKWVFIKPIQEKISPIPINIVLEGVTAEEKELNQYIVDKLNIY